MTQAASDVGVTEKWCNALRGRDPAVARGLFDDASLLHVPGRSGLAGEYQGGDSILGLLELMARLAKGRLEYSPFRVFVVNPHAVIWSHLSAGCPDKVLDTDTVHVLSIDGATLREIKVFYEDQDLVDRFWISTANCQ
jgi:hypothetical protein